MYEKYNIDICFVNTTYENSIMIFVFTDADVLFLAVSLAL